MNWPAFIASVIGSCAWPLTIVVLVLILRAPIRELLPLLREAKYKDFELYFAERAEEAKEAELPEYPRPELESAAPPQRPVPMPEQTPRTMVIAAWLQVEAAATAAAQRLGSEMHTESHRASGAIRFLESSDQVDRRAVSLMRDLRSLRDEAVHVPDFEISDVAAIDYALAAGRLTDYFRSLAASVQHVRGVHEPAGQ